MTETIQTSHIKETDYYSTLSDKEKADIEFFLEWLQYVEVVQPQPQEVIVFPDEEKIH